MTKFKNKTVILNASEGSMDSSAKAIRMTQESGRSMVEMLGALAVIGVLSIAGIAGYTTAMNKYKANEILNGASVRAMHVSAKLQQNSEAEILTALSEFTDNTVGGATFGAAEKVGTSQFKIKFTTAPDSDVCTQMQNTAGTGGIIRSFGTNCDALTYNNDLTTTDPAPSDTLCASVECDPGYECSAGVCVPKAADDPEDTSCAKNADCTNKTMCEGKTCYCAITAENDENYPNCTYSNYTGTCVVVSEGTAPTGTSYKVSSDGMTWWSAVNFCKAVKTGGQLVSLEEVGCEGDGTTPSYNSALSGEGYPDYFWTTDAADCDEDWNRTIGSNNNSCYAFYVVAYRGIVSSYYRNNGGYYALCE